MTSSPVHPPELGRLRREELARWVPWVRGPAELILRCEGSAAARLVHALHVHWPLVRGHSRLMASLPTVPAFTRAKFSSPSGVPLALDMTQSSLFVYLSGKLPSEPLEIAILNRLLRAGDTFVDVGAHRGLFIAHLLGRVRPGGRVIAFEPSPSSAQFLRETFGNPPDLELHEVAVSDHEGSGRLARDGEVFAHLSSANTAGTTAVRIARLDSIVRPPEPSTACFVKVDVEGVEAEVLRGSTGLLAGGGPPFGWLIESLPNEGQRRAALLATIHETKADALVYGISNGVGLIPESSLRDDDRSVNNLLVLAPALLPRLREVGDIVIGSGDR